MSVFLLGGVAGRLILEAGIALVFVWLPASFLMPLMASIVGRRGAIIRGAAVNLFAMLSLICFAYDPSAMRGVGDLTTTFGFGVVTVLIGPVIGSVIEAKI